MRQSPSSPVRRLRRRAPTSSPSRRLGAAASPTAAPLSASTRPRPSSRGGTSTGQRGQSPGSSRCRRASASSSCCSFRVYGARLVLHQCVRRELERVHGVRDHRRSPMGRSRKRSRVRRACISLGSKFCLPWGSARQPAHSARAPRIVELFTYLPWAAAEYRMRSDAVTSAFGAKCGAATSSNAPRAARRAAGASRYSANLWRVATEHPRAAGAREPLRLDATRRKSTDRRGSQCRSQASRGQPRRAVAAIDACHRVMGPGRTLCHRACGLLLL